MDTIDRITDISSRLDHLEAAAEWIAREMVHEDSGVSQTATLIGVLADEVRDRICQLIQDLERGVELEKLN